MALGHERGTISKEEYESTIEELGNIPEKIKSVLAKDEEIKDIARSLTYAENALYMGRGFNYPVALEGALKLKEISYIHAEGYPAAEMKHGPIALIDENMPVVFVATHHQLYKKSHQQYRGSKSKKRPHHCRRNGRRRGRKRNCRSNDRSSFYVSLAGPTSFCHSSSAYSISRGC